MVAGRQVHPAVSFDVNPSSRQVLENLTAEGHLLRLIQAGARIHQAGCNGCIGMGQAPATGRNSLRTVPRNFPGRSGAREDSVYLCSPETATASALFGRITDPRDLAKEMDYPRTRDPEEPILNPEMLLAPMHGDGDEDGDEGKGDGDGDSERIELLKGPNIHSLPELEPLPDTLEGPVLLKVGDDVSTDEILPARTRVLPYRSNIPAISRFTFEAIDDTYWERAREFRSDGHLVVGGRNYGQGSSREHAALAPRYLGVKAVLARSFARIHQQNLANFGILPLVFQEEEDYDRIEEGDTLRLDGIREALEEGAEEVRVQNLTQEEDYLLSHPLSPRQREMILAGSVLNLFRDRKDD